MKSQQKKIINICVWSTVALFVLRCILSWKSILTGVSAYDLFGYASEAISVAVFSLERTKRFFGDIIRLKALLNSQDDTPVL